jgi:hypothetical protein
MNGMKLVTHEDTANLRYELEINALVGAGSQK